VYGAFRRHHTPQQTAGRPIREAHGKLNGEVARHARHPRSIVARMSCVSGVSTSKSRGCDEDATGKLPPWNVGFTPPGRVQYGQHANLIAVGNWRQAGHARAVYRTHSPVNISTAGEYSTTATKSKLTSSSFAWFVTRLT